MGQWLAPASIAAMLAACANMDGRPAAAVEQPQAEGQAIAAELGYHGPVRRSTQRLGAAAAGLTPNPDPGR